MAKAIFPGTFDPPTFGHVNIIERAQGIFDEVHVVIAVNPNKTTLFSGQERLEMLRELLSEWPNVKVAICDYLVVDYARKHNIRLLLRGVRNTQDFSYEFDMSLLNRGLEPAIETLFIPTEPRFLVLKSSAIKELAAFGGDVSGMVPPVVADALHRKAGTGHTRS